MRGRVRRTFAETEEEERRISRKREKEKKKERESKREKQRIMPMLAKRWRYMYNNLVIAVPLPGSMLTTLLQDFLLFLSSPLSSLALAVAYTSQFRVDLL